MNIKMKLGVAIFVLSCVVSPVSASTCARAIAGAQAKVDAAIDKRAGADRAKRESLDAKLGRQPTPFSLAATEGEPGEDLQLALDALDRARDADRAGYQAACQHELASVRAILRRQK
jgi:hypothetical protein